MSDLVLPAPSDITRADVARHGAQVTAWAATADDVAAVRDASAKWSAITEYVRRSSRAGIADAEAVLRRLEMRVGVLLGPAKRDHDRSPGSTSVVTDIERQARHDFRTLAEHPEIVAQVIAESSDASPPSRRKCLAAIAAAHAADEDEALDEALAERGIEPGELDEEEERREEMLAELGGILEEVLEFRGDGDWGQFGGLALDSLWDHYAGQALVAGHFLLGLADLEGEEP